MHGVSNRLTGGPGSANCLQTLISGGMGEGWSDFMAVALTDVASNTRDTDRPLGIYVTNQAEGVRRFPYSTNLQTNPLKFSDLANPQNQEVHNIGEIWEAMLNEVYRNLIDKHGFEKDASKANSGKGNTLMVRQGGVGWGGLEGLPPITYFPYASSLLDSTCYGRSSTPTL